MNSTNATPVLKCDFLLKYSNLVDTTTFVTYYILMPLRFFIGVPNQILAIVVFKKQAKTESAFAYQIFTSVGKILEISNFTIYVILKFFFRRYERRFEWC